MKRFCTILFSLLATACSLIDDDLSGCGVDFTINYQLQLHTELSMQLQTELSAEVEQPVSKAIQRWLGPIFTDNAHDIDLRFYSDNEQDEIRHQIKEIIDDNKTTYTIYLPKENYMHLAIANIDGNSQVQLLEDNHSRSLKLTTKDGSTLPSLNTGVFTARQPMQITDSMSQTFLVHLYMITAATVLVIDDSECEYKDIEVNLSGFADTFFVRDSTFSYSKNQSIQASKIDIEAEDYKLQRKLKSTDSRVCYGAVSYPSNDKADANSVYWQISATTTLEDNKHTTTTFSVNEPLRAGELKIIRCKMKANGELQPTGLTEIGVTVELDWKEGGEHDIEL